MSLIIASKLHCSLLSPMGCVCRCSFPNRDLITRDADWHCPQCVCVCVWHCVCVRVGVSECVCGGSEELCIDSHWCIDGQVRVEQRGRMLVNPSYEAVSCLLLQLLYSLIMKHFKTKASRSPTLSHSHTHKSFTTFPALWEFVHCLIERERPSYHFFIIANWHTLFQHNKIITFC